MNLDDDLDQLHINVDTLLERHPQLSEYFIQAALLSIVIKRIFKHRSGAKLSHPPQYNLRPTVEFMKRLRVTSLEKFDMKTHIASINFYLDADRMEKHQPVGTLIIYVGEDFIPQILKQLQYLTSGEEINEEDNGDAVGTICNLIAGKFKEGLVQMGYRELMMSHFTSYENTAFNGIEYNPQVKEVYEMSYEINGQRQLMAEICMGTIPRA